MTMSTPFIQGGHPGVVYAVSPTDAAAAAERIGPRYNSVVLAPLATSNITRLETVKTACQGVYPLYLAPGDWLLGTTTMNVLPDTRILDQPSTVRILCVGDSLTEGVAGGPGTGYRTGLWTRLLADVGRVSFVGGRSSGPTGPTSNYYDLGEFTAEATGGINCEGIEALVERSTYVSPVDLILVHAVTNNYAESGAVMLQRSMSLVDNLRRKFPGAQVLVSTCQQHGNNATYNANVSAYNAGLKAACKAHGAIYCDVFGQILAAGISGDLIHPTAASFDLAASYWHECIKALVSPLASQFVPRTFASYSSNCIALATTATDYVEVPNLAAARVGAGSAIMSLWVRPTSFDPAAGGAGSQYTIFAHGATAATSVCLRHGTAGEIQLWVGGVNTGTYYAALTLNTWTQLTLYIGSTDGKVHLWIGGKYYSVGATVPGYNYADAGVTRIGLDGLGDAGVLGGMVGQVADWSVATVNKTAFRWAGPQTRDIHAAYYDGVRMPGAAYEYPLNEGVGNPADVMGLGGACTLGGGAAWATQARP